MRLVVAAGFGLVLLIGVACGREPGVAQSAEPTPNIEATVGAAVQTALSSATDTSTPTPMPTGTATRTPTPTSTPTPAATATPQPIYAPTLVDYQTTLRDFFNLGPLSKLVADARYPEIAAVFIARECFAGRAMTAEGFRWFLRHTGAQEKDESALGMVGKILGLTGQDVSESCIRPYMYPTTEAEALLSADLVWAAFAVPGDSRESIGVFGSILREKALSELSKTPQDEPLLASVCCRQVDGKWHLAFLGGSERPIAVPSDVTVPTGGTRLEHTNWSIQRQIDQLRIDQQ